MKKSTSGRSGDRQHLSTSSDVQTSAPAICSDPITGVKVIYAPNRAERINAFADATLVMPVGESCPFCPGNESDTPPAVYLSPSQDVNLSSTPWQVRVVPNRFPALASPTAPSDGSLAQGHHEVLIESPDHLASWTSMPAEQLAAVFGAIISRLQSWAYDPSLQSVQVFKNVGLQAGASLAHPHLQLMAMSFTPKSIQMETERSQSWLQTRGEDYWETLIHDRKNSDLLILRDQSFTTLCPPSSRVPFEMWVLPEKNSPFQHLTPAEQFSLAFHLQKVLRNLEAAHGPVAHNILWRLPPLPSRPETAARWRLEIVPRLVTFAGFELSAGIYINPMLPSAAAAQLRDLSTRVS